MEPRTRFSNQRSSTAIQLSQSIRRIAAFVHSVLQRFRCPCPTTTPFASSSALGAEPKSPSAATATTAKSTAMTAARPSAEPSLIGRPQRPTRKQVPALGIMLDARSSTGSGKRSEGRLLPHLRDFQAETDTAETQRQS